MKILLLGSDGQVGWELQRSLAVVGDVVALCRHADKNPQGLCGDLTQLDALAHTVQVVAPNIIVNAAAHTAVDRAESEPDLARTVNALAPGVLATQAHRLGAWLVHYSTDYVFDGSGSRPWQESDATGPLSVYGTTKLEGEQAIASECARHLILRTSWVYGARGGNFAKTMLRLAQQREILQIIDDQIGAPTGADLLADVTAHAIRRLTGTDTLASAGGALGGIYHLAASGHTSWYGYAKHVFAQALAINPALQLVAKEINPVPTTSFPTPARRPHNSRLDTTKFQSAFGLQLPHWQAGVDRMLQEISA
jgi:dTDP-4-dehydrorhamnose reductase